VHIAALHLAPILAAEKSKVPYYIAGGLLVAWALLVSLGLGLRRPDFPGDLTGQRAVIAITAVLVLATVSMAVVTSGTTAKAGATTGSAQQTSTATPPPAPTESSAAAPPKATTGTPPPPSSPAPNAAGRSLKLAANPAGELSFNTKQLSARAGSVTLTMSNMSPLEHNVVVAHGSTVLGTTPTFIGGAKTLTVTLKPGSYTFYCSVPGHRQAGMEGTLTVS
jgi:plastocyanin